MIWIFDDNFFGFSQKDFDRGLEVIGICRSYGLKVGIMATVDQIVKLNDILKTFSDTIIIIYIGVENGSAASVEYLGKACNRPVYCDNCKKAVKIINDSNILPYLGYINFHPSSTLDDLIESAEFLHEIKQSYTFYHFYNCLTIFEGTRLYDKHIVENDILWHNDIDNGRQYIFSDPRVNSLYSILSLVIDVANVLDYLFYEASLIINFNMIQDDVLNKKLSVMKEIVGSTNYNFFIKSIELCKNNADAVRVLDCVESFRKQDLAYIHDLFNLVSSIEKKCGYFFNDTLFSMDLIKNKIFNTFK